MIVSPGQKRTNQKLKRKRSSNKPEVKNENEAATIDKDN